MTFDDTTKTITIKRGDDFDWTVNFKSGEESIDMTGTKFWFTVRKSAAPSTTLDDSDSVIYKEFDGNASGIYTLSLTSDDTDISYGTYYYDIQYKSTSSKKSSSSVGKFIVTSDITRAR